jgi:Porin subfamily
MKLIKSLILGSSAGLIAMSGAQAADLPLKAKAVEYVKICSLYGAGFWYIPGTDTCIRIGGAIRIDTAINGGIYDNPFWQGGASGSQAYGKDWYTTRSRFNLTEDTRTATEYGVLRTYANVQMDWTRGSSGIAGGGIVEVDYAFMQFAGFTFGKTVSQFDPQWALSKPTIGSGLWAGSNNATGINTLAYTATFGNGVSGTISLEDAQPYRTAGVVDTSTAGLNFFAPTGAGSVPGALGLSSFTGNAVAGDHVPDVVGNLRLDQAWGTLHFAAAAHEVHANYYTPTDSTTGHPASTYGYAFSGAVEFKNLPTGAGDSFKAEASFAHGAAKYVFGGTIDGAGGGRLFRTSGNGPTGTLAFGEIIDGIYTGTNAALPNATNISLSNAWEVSAFFEHYWNPQWRTSLFGNYSAISYGSAGGVLATVLAGTTGTLALTNATLDFSTAQVGTRTAWTPVKDLTFAAEFQYNRLMPKATGTFTQAATGGAITGAPAGAVYTIGSQNVYVGAVNVTRSF